MIDPPHSVLERTEDSPMEYSINVDEGIESVAKLFERWFSTASESIWMSTGLTKGILNREPVQRALSEAAGHLDVRILLDCDVSDAKLVNENYGWLWESGVKVKRSNEKVDHWVLIDSSKVRMERPHGPNPEKRSNFRIERCDPRFAESKKAAFNVVWERAELLPELPRLASPEPERILIKPGRGD